MIMINKAIPCIRIIGEQEFVNSINWAINHNLKINNVGFYSAFNFGEIRFSNIEDAMMFRLSNNHCLLISE